MAGKISSFPNGIQGGDARATAAITTNTRVMTPRGVIGLVTDAVMFPDGAGVWFMGNQRVSINGVPTIGASSVGVFTPANPVEPPVAMLVAEADSSSDAM